MFQRGGSTCIGCGIQLAQQHIIQRPRPQATKFMIVLTDGLNNVNTSQFAGIVAQAKNAGTNLLAIGVGPSVSAAEINLIASSIPGVQTAS